MLHLPEENLFSLFHFQVHHAADGDQSRPFSFPINRHGHYHSSVLLIALLTGLGIALAVIPSLMSPIHHDDKINLSKVVFPLVGSTFAILMTLVYLLFIFKRNTWLKNGRVKYIGKIPAAFSSINERYLVQEPTDDNVQLITPSTRSNKGYHVALSPISVFGIGGGVSLICTFILKMCPSPHDIALSVYAIAMLISLAFQVIFFAVYDGAILKNSAIFHYLIALMIADKIGVWVTFALVALPEISPENKAINHTDISPKRIINITDISPHEGDWIVRTSLVLKLFLEPFYIEFLTVSITALFQWWNLMTEEKGGSIKVSTNESLTNEGDERHTAVENTSPNREEIGEHPVPEINDEDGNEGCESLCDADNLLPSRQVQTRRLVTRLEKLATVLFVAFLIIIAISYFIGEQILYVGPLHTLVEGKIKPSVANYIFRGSQIVIYTPYFLICIITIYTLYRKNNSSRLGPAPFNSSLTVAIIY